MRPTRGPGSLLPELGAPEVPTSGFARVAGGWASIGGSKVRAFLRTGVGSSSFRQCHFRPTLVGATVAIQGVAAMCRFRALPQVLLVQVHRWTSSLPEAELEIDTSPRHSSSSSLTMALTENPEPSTAMSQPAKPCVNDCFLDLHVDPCER